MLKKYLIVINDPITKEELQNFSKVIASNYVSISGGENIFLFLSSDDNAKIVWDKLNKKMDGKVAFIVTELHYWYGNMPTEVFDWLAEKFPDDQLLR